MVGLKQNPKPLILSLSYSLTNTNQPVRDDLSSSRKCGKPVDNPRSRTSATGCDGRAIGKGSMVVCANRLKSGAYRVAAVAEDGIVLEGGRFVPGFAVGSAWRKAGYDR